ncbi:MAG: leucyl/phenylalanyl-tRNA--protein transferase [Nitriliruptorales bacterium]|nr:leucyl/phenylalanyl-tRNA--protein transferase [Nitriliruptorales bacterium]
MRRQPPSRFPDPRRAPGDAPLAWGGDLEPPTLLDAYSHGIFPWPTGDGTVLWWSPDPRAVIPLGGLHVSRSLRRTLTRGRFRCTVDTDFAAVVRGCADRPGEGTWITEEMIRAYEQLHALGLAHAVGVRDADHGALVGGIYGVALGAAFMGESMFSRATDASKVALVHLVERLNAAGFALFDAQMPTPHLTSLGAVTVTRDTFLRSLADALARRTSFAAPAGSPR